MKRRVIAGINRLISWLIALLLLMGVAAAPVYAADDTTTDSGVLPLDPKDLVYEDGNVILHKHGERIGPTEWKVTVRATIGEKPIEKRKMEVVFLLDISSSMRNNTAHEHNDDCSKFICEKELHTHSEDCYSWTCNLEEHTHSEECCGKEEHTHSLEDCCGIVPHTHSIRNRCYSRCKDKDHESNQDHREAGCIEYDDKWYQLTCELEEVEHTHTQACMDNCTKEEHTHDAGTCIYSKCGVTEEHTHVEGKCYTLACGKQEHKEHTLGCWQCPYYVPSDHSMANHYRNDGDASRMAVAAVAAERLIASLPEEVTTVKRLAFDADFHTGISSYYDVETGSGTYMWNGIYQSLTKHFTNNDTQKVFVVVTDGQANSGDVNANQSKAKEALQTFKKAGGEVFSVGFGYEADVLKNIASKDEYYMTATNAESLNLAFEEIERELTAMLVDPMGTTVGFDSTSILGASTTSGVISWSSDTIYWNPSEDGQGTVSNSTIEYSYTVELNSKADETVGEHYNVELNNPTDFLYGIKNADGTVTEMKEAAFPIPRALYKLSSIETSWVDEDGDPIPITGYNQTIESDPIISDYKDANYIPAFDPKYTDITQRIYLTDGSGDYYQYTGSTVQAVHYVTYHDDNEAGMTTTKTETIVADVTDLGAIDPSQPYHYIVVHNYKLVEAEKLPLGGTKTLIGRDFQADDESQVGDTFTFTLTAETDGAPMPKNNVVTIEPASGTTATFEFDEIIFTDAADKTYVYKIQETKGDLPGVVYDTRVRTLRVTVEDGKVVSYTIDNVENAPLLFTNSLTPGNLKVEKTEVISYNADHQNQEFKFIIQVKDMSNRPMTGTYTAKKSDGTEFTVTFDAGYVVNTVTDENNNETKENLIKLKVRESVEIIGLPMGATYIVTEDKPGGFTATATGDKGTIIANETVTASFANEYHTTGQYQFRATKVLKDASGKTLDLTQGQFAFQVLDAAGKVVADGTNNVDGSIFFDTLTFTEDDIGTDGKGTKTYQIVEVAGSDAGILYDRTVYKVTLTIADKGDGNLTITDDLGTDGKITFTNTKISNQLVVSKTVAGNLGSRNREFSFTLDLGGDKANTTVNISKAGAAFTTVTLDANGQTTFTLKHGESISVYPVDGTYTVTEAESGYTTTYSIKDKDGTVTGKTTSASGNVDANGAHVAFVNTLEATVPTGIHTPVTSALIGICLAAGLIAIAFAGRREVCYES